MNLLISDLTRLQSSILVLLVNMNLHVIQATIWNSMWRRNLQPRLRTEPSLFVSVSQMLNAMAGPTHQWPNCRGGNCRGSQYQQNTGTSQRRGSKQAKGVEGLRPSCCAHRRRSGRAPGGEGRSRSPARPGCRPPTSRCCWPWNPPVRCGWTIRRGQAVWAGQTRVRRFDVCASGLGNWGGNL